MKKNIKVKLGMLLAAGALLTANAQECNRMGTRPHFAGESFRTAASSVLASSPFDPLCAPAIGGV